LQQDGTGESVAKAVELLKAHILTDHYPTADDFKSKAVVNRLGNAVPVEVKRGSVVVTGSGGKSVNLTADGEFKSNNDKYTVWKADGPMPTTGEKFSPEQHAPKPVGGADSNNRILFSQMLCKTMCQQLQTQRTKPGHRLASPYVNAVIGIARFLKASPDYARIYAGLLPDMDYSPEVTYHLWVQPYKTRGRQRIPDEVFADINSLYPAKAGWQEYKSLMNDIRSPTYAPSGSAIIAKAADVQKQIEQVRGRILANPGKQETASEVEKFYDNIQGANSIEGLSNVYSNNGDLDRNQRQWQDEVRLIIGTKVREVLNDKIANYGAFMEVLRCIELNYPGNDYTNEREITVAKSKGWGSDYYHSVPLYFVRSTYLGYFLLPAGEVGSVFAAPSSAEVFNVSDTSTLNLPALVSQLLDTQYSIDGGKKGGARVHASSELDYAISIIREYREKHGSVPDELKDLVKSKD